MTYWDWLSKFEQTMIRRWIPCITGQTPSLEILGRDGDGSTVKCLKNSCLDTVYYNWLSNYCPYTSRIMKTKPLTYWNFKKDKKNKKNKKKTKQKTRWKNRHVTSGEKGQGKITVSCLFGIVACGDGEVLLFSLHNGSSWSLLLFVLFLFFHLVFFFILFFFFNLFLNFQ